MGNKRYGSTKTLIMSNSTSKLTDVERSLLQSKKASEDWLNPEYRLQLKIRAIKHLLEEAKKKWKL